MGDRRGDYCDTQRAELARNSRKMGDRRGTKGGGQGRPGKTAR